MTAAKIASAGLPTESYPTELKQYFNGEGVHLIHQPAAHSDGDTIVHFRGSDVISTGDMLSTVSYPTFDVARGGSINGVIDGLNRLLDLVIAEYQTEGGTLLIPGHGRVCDAADLATYRDAVTIIRDRVQDMIKRGNDRGPGQGGPADEGLRPPLRRADVDQGPVRRGGVSQPLAEKVSMSTRSAALVVAVTMLALPLAMQAQRGAPAGGAAAVSRRPPHAAMCRPMRRSIRPATGSRSCPTSGATAC